MMVWKMVFLFQGCIFGFHVNGSMLIFGGVYIFTFDTNTDIFVQDVVKLQKDHNER